MSRSLLPGSIRVVASDGSEARFGILLARFQLRQWTDADDRWAERHGMTDQEPTDTLLSKWFRFEGPVPEFPITVLDVYVGRDGRYAGVLEDVVTGAIVGVVANPDAFAETGLGEEAMCLANLPDDWQTAWDAYELRRQR